MSTASPHHAADAAAIAILEGLRQRRARTMRAKSLTALLADQHADLRRLRRRLAGAGSAWAQCCPPELAPLTVPTFLRAGVLSVAVADAAARYRVDRWLRAGGLTSLQRASAAPLQRVRLETASAPGLNHH